MQFNKKYIRKRKMAKLQSLIERIDLSQRKLWFIGILIVLYAFVAGGTGFYAQLRLRKEGRDLQKSIELERQKNKWLHKEADSLKNDRTRIEKEARQEHGMGEDDEIIFKID